MASIKLYTEDDDEEDEVLPDSVMTSFTVNGREYIDIGCTFKHIQEAGEMGDLIYNDSVTLLLTTNKHNKDYHPDPILSAAWCTIETDRRPANHIGPESIGGYELK